ncbi:unnamed protein product [Clonostachys byssicola]|uniref:Beta-glucuronidase C-terminal domain-containing protein n=1 Tax=Clonostachys byssicola TaxID=160290 RepID=A0A9N9U270_9HYPO|nr:unnamed protein product [Clonostachys byssicola]
MAKLGLEALVILAYLFQICIAATAQDLPLYLPREKPEWAEHLSPNLASFSIEMDTWPDWAGKKVGEPNEYFNQILRNLGERTGHMPFLRVGAISQDRATIDLQYEVMNATFPEPTPQAPNPQADHIFIGRDFYALSGNLPEGTSFMWGLNLKDLNKTETVAQAQLLAESFIGSRAHLTSKMSLEYVELGNEPDFWGPTRWGSYRGPYGPEWNTLNYTATWVDFAKAVSGVFHTGESETEKPKLSPGGFTGFMSPEWTPQGPLLAGLLDDPDIRERTSQFTEHAYSGGFDPYGNVRPGELMNKLSVRANMSAIVSRRHAVQGAGLRYVLTFSHGQPGLSNTVESALWAADWLLLGASYGIERLHFHHGIGYRYNLVQPVDSSDDGLNITRPHILPSYHAFLIVNEAIGKSGDSYVTELSTTDLNMTAYGIWETNVLVRAVVLNTQVYLGEGEKPGIEVQLIGPGAQRPCTVKRLNSDTTTSFTGM